jgi:hypothetical protein
MFFYGVTSGRYEIAVNLEHKNSINRSYCKNPTPFKQKPESVFLSPDPETVHLIASIPKLFDIILSQQRKLCLLMRPLL